MNKWAFVAGAGIGYVLGTRAGREQYNRMAAQAKEFLDKPQVREVTDTVQTEATRLFGEGKSLLKEKLRQLRLDADEARVTQDSTTPVGNPINGATAR